MGMSYSTKTALVEYGTLFVENNMTRAPQRRAWDTLHINGLDVLSRFTASDIKAASTVNLEDDSNCYTGARVGAWKDRFSVADLSCHVRFYHQILFFVHVASMPLASALVCFRLAPLFSCYTYYTRQHYEFSYVLERENRFG